MKHTINLNSNIKKESESILLSTNCRLCKDDYLIEVKKKDYHNYQNGELIQKAFPYLKPEYRELLISQTCDDCWNKMFS